MQRIDRRLREADPRFAKLFRKIPLQNRPPLSPEWLRFEMLERELLLRGAPIAPGSTALEVGAGSHAIATVPIALRLGKSGRLVSVERSRWDHFAEIVTAGGVQDQVYPVACDARTLPFQDDCFDLALCIHGVRSLGGERDITTVFHEMFRVAPRTFLAESLPVAKTDAQRAHLRMYDLREEVFAATSGRRDDRHYEPLNRLVGLVERAGGVVERSSSLDVDLPHALAYFPRSIVESISNAEQREALLRRWDAANSLLERFGEDHPPVGVIVAHRSPSIPGNRRRSSLLRDA